MQPVLPVPRPSTVVLATWQPIATTPMHPEYPCDTTIYALETVCLAGAAGFELLHFGIRSAAVDHDLRFSLRIRCGAATSIEMRTFECSRPERRVFANSDSEMQRFESSLTHTESGRARNATKWRHRIELKKSATYGLVNGTKRNRQSITSLLKNDSANIQWQSSDVV